jgi:hypothetical protein
MRKVCKHCGNTEFHELGGEHTCKACRRKDAPLEMHFAHVPGYKRDLTAREEAKHFSWRRCEEIQAFWLWSSALVLLVLFVWLSW